MTDEHTYLHIKSLASAATWVSEVDSGKVTLNIQDIEDIPDDTPSPEGLSTIPPFSGSMEQPAPAVEGFHQQECDHDQKAGPAGLFLTSLLARNGLTEKSSLLCIDPRLHVRPAGHADGLHARSLEVFKVLGLYEELMKVSTEVGERARWAEVPPSSCQESESPSAPASEPARMERVMRQKLATAPNARMKQLISIPQGQIERILEEDLKRNAPEALWRGPHVIESRIDETVPSHPVLVTIRDSSGTKTTTREIRCKYLVGADGAHSTIRKNFDILMEGDSTDHVWGVIDFVADTNFPDIRRLTTVQNSSGMAMIIPREKNADGEWLTRFYVDMNDIELKSQQSTNMTHVTGHPEATSILIVNQNRKSNIKDDCIYQRLAEIFAPFQMTLKKGTETDWSTAYAIGQRVASDFAKTDSNGVPRVFLVGDACHTHSPKLGQGMNVSMADSFNLAWKLQHAVCGTAADSTSLLQSYVSERRRIAQQLIELDRRWYNIQWADSERMKQPGYLEECTKLYQEISGFTSGCGIEYAESVVVVNPAQTSADNTSKFIFGTVENDGGFIPTAPGKRLLNTRMLRLADGCQWDIHDSLAPDAGSFKAVIFCGRDILSPVSDSANAIQIVLEQLIPQFSITLLNASVVTPGMVYAPTGPSERLFAISEYDLWELLPNCTKRDAEMTTYALSDTGYNTYGIDPNMGAVAVVRPDGIVGSVMPLDPQVIEAQLKDFLGAIFVAK
ncbi:aminotransferase class 3 [Penicillium canariense]|uniref:Aminotransferase class 3 n=1 Tax=Penicillium canariense TaxID=189055 RepID=A0A9W9LJY5_9EURO|nr:aminotransferase class 3 [Penicillium canariense]KAJ5160053.1 aminotransferase class 3 [Penicillium canariense]